jgi:MFS family permease
MTRYLVPIAGLLLSVAILLIGHGLQLTLIPLRGELLGWSATEIGLTGSAYFLGFVAGCLAIPRIIARVGHIRTFAVLAAVATAVILLISLSASLAAWLLLRFATGCALSGLYMVIESWLNEKSPNELRGAILSLYAMLTMVAIASGQLFLGASNPIEATLFITAALFMCLSILPVGLTGSSAPQPVHEVQFRPRQLFRTSQVSVIAALLGGMVTGSFWALGPLYASQRGLSAENVGLFMTATILGGAALQFPLGRLSDRIDRRVVILAVTACGAAAAIAMWWFTPDGSDWLYALAFLYGATSMPLYALCVAHANDNITASTFVETASGILMMNSIGSVVGPTLTAPLMSLFGPGAMFGFATLCYVASAVWCLVRLRAHPVERGHYQPFASLPKTTQGAIDLDPRTGPDTSGTVSR